MRQEGLAECLVPDLLEPAGRVREVRCGKKLQERQDKKNRLVSEALVGQAPMAVLVEQAEVMGNLAVPELFQVAVAAVVALVLAAKWVV